MGQRRRGREGKGREGREEGRKMTWPLPNKKFLDPPLIMMHALLFAERG
jgi:hypothetical protein